MTLHGKEHAAAVVVIGVVCIVIVAIQAISKVTIAVVVNTTVVVDICGVHGSHGAGIIVDDANTTDTFIVANNVHIEIAQCLSVAAIQRGVYGVWGASGGWSTRPWTSDWYMQRHLLLLLL